MQRSAAAIGTDPSYIATAILPILAAAIGTSRQIILKRGWIEPSLLWGVLVGESGTLKSPAIDAATKHVRKRQAAAVEVNRVAQEQYEQDQEAFKLAYDDWRKGGRKKGEEPPEKPEKPTCPRVCCSDVTVEGLAVLLADAPRGLLLIRDELSGWIGSFDQYKTGHGADTAHWLTIHGARDLLVDRKTGDKKTLFVRRAAVSIVGGIQPGTLRRVLGAEHFEDGLAARFLLAMPPRRPKRWTEVEVDPVLDQEVEDLLDRLYQVQHQADESGLPEPVTVGMTPAGRAAWIEFYNTHAQRQADATGEEAAVLAKVEGAAARIALVVHLIRQETGDQAAGGAVDAKSITAGVALARWYADEAVRVYGVLTETDEDRLHRRLVELIERKGGSISARILRRSMRQFRDSTEAAEAALDALVQAGLGTWQATGTAEDGGRPTRIFRLSTPSTSTEPTSFPQDNGGYVDVDTVDGCQIEADQWEEIVV